MAKKIGIVYCKRIQDQSCVGCAKCYKAVNDGLFAFEGMGGGWCSRPAAETAPASSCPSCSSR
jgi:hypothetical protein